MSRKNFERGPIRVYDFKNKVTIREANKENNWNGYYEVPYVDYRENGTICNIGTEDFTSQSLHLIKIYDVMEKTGEKTKESSINKGGRNRWKCIKTLRVANRSNAVKVANFLYPNKEIQVRLL